MWELELSFIIQSQMEISAAPLRLTIQVRTYVTE